MNKLQHKLQRFAYYCSQIFEAIKLFLIAFKWSFLVCLVYFLFKNISLDSIRISYCYLIAKFWVAIGFDSMDINLSFLKDGVYTTASWIVNNKLFPEIYSNLKKTIAYSFFKAFIWSIVFGIGRVLFWGFNEWYDYRRREAFKKWLWPKLQSIVPSLFKSTNNQNHPASWYVRVADVNQNNSVAITASEPQKIASTNLAENNLEEKGESNLGYKLVADKNLPYPILKRVILTEPEEKILNPADSKSASSKNKSNNSDDDLIHDLY